MHIEQRTTAELVDLFTSEEDHVARSLVACREKLIAAADLTGAALLAGGRTPFVLGALARARALGARTILLTCNPARPRAVQPWDVEIDLPVGPEIITGSTRLKAGTATKVVLNFLSTCAMIRLGRVCGNAMIDLKISNAKLRDRGVRIVSAALGLDSAAAQERLERAGWNVRACLDSEE